MNPSITALVSINYGHEKILNISTGVKKLLDNLIMILINNIENK